MLRNKPELGAWRRGSNLAQKSAQGIVAKHRNHLWRFGPKARKAGWAATLPTNGYAGSSAVSSRPA